MMTLLRSVVSIAAAVLVCLSTGCGDTEHFAGDGGAADGSTADGGTADDGIVDADTSADAGALSAEVDALAQPLVDPTGDNPERAVGLSVVVVSAGLSEVLSYGARRIGGSPTDAMTCFPVGSVSKVFTGLLLASAIEASEGTMGPDDLVNAHLAADLRAPQSGGVGITLEDLVSHYSALPNFPDNMTGPQLSPALDYTRAQFSTFLAGHSLERDPGSAYQYSNVGSGLLGVALADSAAEPDFDALLSSHLTIPLGMSGTGTRTPEFLSAIGDRLVQPYRAEAGSLQGVAVSDMGVLAGGGEVLSTGEDMLVFLRAFTGLDSFMVAGAIERALSIVHPAGGSESVAYALDVRSESDGSRIYEKAGVTAGTTTYIAFSSDPPAGVAILSNRGEHMAIRAVARSLLSRLRGR